MSETTPLPFQFAIRSYLNDVSYGNPMPNWYSPQRIDYAAREKTLKERATRYLNGGTPLPVLTVSVPSRTGEMRDWVVPAVNDQMLLNACACSLSKAIGERFDSQHVYSYRPNKDADRLALTTNQLAGWLDFQQETVKRIQAGQFVLEFDIRRAYASVDRSKFLKYVEELGEGSTASKLLQVLLTKWNDGGKGIPLINDSLFFIGNSYLSLIDRIVSRYTNDFIRYVDDYRVFASSSAKLEAIYAKVSAELTDVSMEMNPTKVKLASKADYLEPAMAPVFQPAGGSPYVVALDTTIDSQLEPSQIVKLVVKALNKPNENLNDGTGRYLLGAIRRYRLNAAIYSQASSAETSPGKDLQKLLLAVPNISALIENLLKEYVSTADQYWRVVWLTYLIGETSITEPMRKVLEGIESGTKMPEVARLWAKRCLDGRGGEPVVLPEALDELDYLAAGKMCYGGPKCIGAGF